jgi:hypothetical protein
MTLTRPAYAVTVTNVTHDWTVAVTAGDPFDKAAPFQVLDSLTASWKFGNYVFPGPMDAAEVSFQLRAKTAATLPAIDQGDVLVVTLTRPTAGDPKVYMRFVGRITDLDAVTRPNLDVIVNVVALDPLAEDDTEVVLEPDLVTAGEAAAGYVAAAAGLPFSYDPDDVLPIVRLSGANGAGTWWERIAAAGYAAGDEVRILRADLDWPADGDTRVGAGPFRYLLDRWELGLPADAETILTVVEDPADHLVVTVAVSPTAGDVVSPTVLSARHVVTPTTWRKNRASVVNTLKVTGRDEAGDVAYTAVNADLVARFGENSRTVETVAQSGDLVAIAGTVASTLTARVDWRTEELTVITKNMTDELLDRLANRFWSAPRSAGAHQVLALVDIADDVQLTRSTIISTVVGATFSVAGGDLVIVAAITPRELTLPPGGRSPGVTYDQWMASPFADTTTDPSTTHHHLNPAVTYDELKLATL